MTQAAKHAPITVERVQKMAALARLELSPDEAQLYAGQLDSILGFFEAIQSVDVAGVEPLLTPHETPTPYREDVARAAPETARGEAGGFKVPQVL